MGVLLVNKVDFVGFGVARCVVCRRIMLLGDRSSEVRLGAVFDFKVTVLLSDVTTSFQLNSKVPIFKKRSRKLDKV